MPHLLDIDDQGIARMFYAKERGVPWHGLGRGVSEAQTSEQAVQLAGLDWEVAIGPLWGGPRQLPVDGHYAVYRATDGKVLGISSEKYKPIQNREMFNFMDSLISDRVMRYETAGAMMGGKRIWLLARLDEDIEIAGDAHVPYLLLVSGHDLNSSLKIFPTLVRVVCYNTLTQAIRQADNTNAPMVRITHSGDTQSKLGKAQDILSITTAQMRKYQQYLGSLVDVTVTNDELEAVKEGMFGPLDDQTPTQRRKLIETFEAIYAAEQAIHDSTAYTLVQAVVGLADHGTRVRSLGRGDERLASVLSGSIAGNKRKYLNIVSEVLTLPAGAALFA